MYKIGDQIERYCKYLGKYMETFETNYNKIQQAKTIEDLKEIQNNKDIN